MKGLEEGTVGFATFGGLLIVNGFFSIVPKGLVPGMIGLIAMGLLAIAAELLYDRVTPKRDRNRAVRDFLIEQSKPRERT